MDSTIQRAAQVIQSSRALIITAGAGMGVDSGLPDFRGNDGFWKAYPPYRHLARGFTDCANPAHFDTDPAFAWGFYGHRTELYRRTVPHSGFALLQTLAQQLQLERFILTSNVDGQFQKAGYPAEQILEVHGSIHTLQCSVPCCDSLWPNRFHYHIDQQTMTTPTWPTCPTCGAVARPNILMFNDSRWLAGRYLEQQKRLECFLDRTAESACTIIEMGAGRHVPTIRHLSEQLAQPPNRTLIRINPRESDGPPGTLSLASTAHRAIKNLAKMLNLSTS